MDRKSVSAAVLIVAASAFYPRQISHSGTEAGPPPTSVASASTAKQVTPSEEGPWKPICDHFRLEEKPGTKTQKLKIDIDARDPAQGITATFHADAGGGAKSEPLAQQYCLDLPDAKETTFRTMVVLAPDPELTHLSLDFDRTMESIVWAVTDGGFQIESYWFPWQKPPDKEETDPDKRKALKHDQEERLQNPGILLFRDADSRKNGLLAVFVVGDRPDFGPSRVQFQAAVEGIRVLQPGLTNDISLVGPSFSGSIQPLQRLTAAYKCDRFFVVTGRATNRDAVVGFSGNDTSPPSLCSTIENDETALDGFGRFALSSGLQLGGQVAILNEDETTYGNTPYTSGNRLGSTVQFRFPRGISRLRNSVEELPGSTPAPSNTTGYQALPLILKEPGQDTIQSFSNQLTPLSSEAVLLNIAVSLRHMRIHYAGILATDPLDALFLARFLRSAAPDIRLFFLEPDALFAREAHNSNLEGVVTISNYPLVLENQYGSYPSNRISFASGYEEATYNACRRVMFRWTGIDPSRSCDATNSLYLPKNILVGYQSPFPEGSHAAEKPALWVTVLGHESYWPVALLENEGSTVLAGPPPEDPCKPFEAGPEPFIWRVLFLSLMAFNLAHLIFIGLNVPRLRDYTFFKAILRFDPVRNLRIRPGSPYAGGQAASIAIMYVALTLVNVIFLISALTFHWRESWFCGFFVIVFVPAAIWITVQAVRYRESWLGSPLLAALPWFSALVYLHFLRSLWERSEVSHASFFFVYRSIHLDNGVSPTAPLLALAAGFYYWAWIQTRRFRLADELRPEMPATVIAPRNFMGEIHGVFGKKASFLFGLLTVIFFLLFCPFIYVHTVEGRGYDVLIAMALLATYAMLIGSLVRFSILWRDLRTILQFLERHPLRAAFTRLPHTFSWTSIWQGDLKPTYVTIARSRDCLRRLNPSLDIPVNRNLKYLHNAQANKVFQFQQAYFDKWRYLQRLFKRSADQIAGELQSHWEEGISDSIDEARKPSLDPDRTTAPKTVTDELPWFREEFLALQYVTLIRYGFFQMRNFLEFVTGGFILMVMAVYVYPFEDHRLLGAANITMFALLAVGMLVAFAQMDRDPVLSRLSATKPQLDMNFVWRVVSYGSLPLLALLGSQFPTLGNFLFSWVQPALQSMK